MKSYDDTLSNSGNPESKDKPKKGTDGENNISGTPNISKVKNLPPFDLDSACKIHGCEINELDCAVNVCKVNEGKNVYSASFEDQNVSRKSEHGEKAHAAISKPSIVTRDEWGAMDPKRSYEDHSPDKITIHHTKTPQDGEDRVRSIQRHHMEEIDDPWDDIGYHYLIDSAGKIYEGRPVEVEGAHVKSHNPGNIGIAVIGNFNNKQLNDRQKKAIENLGAWLCDEYSISSDDIKGHRDYDETNECPGDNLYDSLPEIRKNVKNTRQRKSNVKPACKCDNDFLPCPHGNACTCEGISY